MKETERQDIEQTVAILRRLDRNSLLIIDSGAKMLMARQELASRKEETDNKLQAIDKKIVGE